MTRLIIGIGNSFRRDDGAGPMVAERLSGRMDTLILPGEGTELIEAWSGRDEVIVIDAMRSGGEAGMVRRFDGLAETLPQDAFPCLSHRFGLAEAVEMAKVLERLPAQLTIYGIEAADFGQGPGLSAEVEAAVARIVAEIGG